MQEKRTWIFEYDLLLWDHFDYKYIDKVEAILLGCHRSFNRYSLTSWGTSENPGIVLGTETGGEIKGTAYLVEEDMLKHIDNDQVMNKDFLRVKTPQQDIKVAAAGEILDDCFVYISNPASKYHMNGISINDAAEIISKSGSGIHGTGVEYIDRSYTASQLKEINDVVIEEMYKEVHSLLEKSSI